MAIDAPWTFASVCCMSRNHPAPLTDGLTARVGNAVTRASNGATPSRPSTRHRCEACPGAGACAMLPCPLPWRKSRRAPPRAVEATSSSVRHGRWTHGGMHLPGCEDRALAPRRAGCGLPALVCAASKGLGYACAAALVQAGVHVVIVARSEEPSLFQFRYEPRATLIKMP